MLNLFVTIPIVIAIVCYLAVAVTEFNLIIEGIKLLLCPLVSEIWFFTAHYIAHHPLFYRRFHKLHHKYTAPVSINALCGTTIDFGLGSAMSIGICPILLNCHIFTIYGFVFMAICSNAISHSEYDTFTHDNKFHDAHHQHFDCNYGYGIIMDSLFCTIRR